MKRIRIKILSAIIFSFLILICTRVIIRNLRDLSAKEVDTDDTINTVNTEEIELKDEDKNVGKFEIKLPQLYKNSEEMTSINNLIFDKVKSEILQLDEEGTLYDFSYTVKSFNSKIISVLFELSFFGESAAYPFDAAFTVNMDIQNEEEIDTTSLLNEEALCEYIKSGKAKDDLVENDNDSVNGKIYWYPEEYLEEEETSWLLNDIREADLYFTSNKVGIVMNVIHAVGDYFLLEVEDRKFFDEEVIEQYIS